MLRPFITAAWSGWTRSHKKGDSLLAKAFVRILKLMLSKLIGLYFFTSRGLPESFGKRTVYEVLKYSVTYPLLKHEQTNFKRNGARSSKKIFEKLYS